MNIDIQNIAMYRVTSHGGRSYDLYNRDNGLIFTINEEEYRQIIKSNDLFICRWIERLYRKRCGV